MLMSALNYATETSHEIVIVGEAGSEDTREMLRAIRGKFLPNKIVLLRESKSADELTGLAEFTKFHTSIDGKATAYVCRNYACELPTTDVTQMMKLLAGI